MAVTDPPAGYHWRFCVVCGREYASAFPQGEFCRGACYLAHVRKKHLLALNRARVRRWRAKKAAAG